MTEANSSTRILNIALQVAMVLVSVCVFAAKAGAVPITYTLVVMPNPLSALNVGPSGTLGTLVFGQTTSVATVTFTFESDTANVISFLAAPPGVLPAGGYENLVGTASVTVTDSATGAVLGKANFLPSAGIFVSIDNTNQGIGFGSFAVANQSDPNFPGQPVYPYAMSSVGLNTYDLRSDFTIGPTQSPYPDYTIADSCAGFPHCQPPLALPTDAGDLIINRPVAEYPQLYAIGVFTAQKHPLTAFSAFKAKLELSGLPPAGFEINGAFTLGNGSQGINPSTEPVTLQLGTLSMTIPKGSFRQTRKGAYVYQGTVAGIALEVRIVAVNANSYRFSVEGSGALAGITSPVTVVLTIGDDGGNTTAQPSDD